MNTMPGHNDNTTKSPVYWRKNQVMLTFIFQENLDNLETFLREVSPDLELLNWHTYSAQESGSAGSVNIAAFYRIKSASTPETAHNHATPGDTGSDLEDRTLEFVNDLNKPENRKEQMANYRARPVWLCSSVSGVTLSRADDNTHGCPVTPPFPVRREKILSPAGQFKTTLPDLPPSLQEATGKGVTVFILDAFPKEGLIRKAAKKAGSQNTLLQQIEENMNVVHRQLKRIELSEQPDPPVRAEPPAIDLLYYLDGNIDGIPSPEYSAVTGKDIYGRLAGFPMPDHGLFIAGLVRDLAHDANIECIRVLNDFGVGDINTLFAALTYIKDRMNDKNDLKDKPVVINLSLVIGPPECDLSCLPVDPQTGLPEQLNESLKYLFGLLQSMAGLGAVFVASVGNDSDPRDFVMNPSELRFNARYPAAFGNDQPGLIIPVGAVNQTGEPSAYSNYPGSNGIATYGGELPKPDPWLPSAASHKITHIASSTDGTPIDALCGIYTAPVYPALSKNDKYPLQNQTDLDLEWSSYPHYAPSSSNAWAHWPGTSFAAPIITALAARILQDQPELCAKEHGGEHEGKCVGECVHAAITNAGQPMVWTGLQDGANAGGLKIVAIQTWQELAPEYNAQEP